jgi:hypothetical protein
VRRVHKPPAEGTFCDECGAFINLPLLKTMSIKGTERLIAVRLENMHLDK